jgi:hypothetical protein
MSDGAHADSALRRFIADLNRARHAAGRPSCARLEALSAQLAKENRHRGVELIVLANSTTNEILGGQRAGAPKWPWVFSYVMALQAAARKAGVPVGNIGTMDEWKRKHEAVCAAEWAARHPLGVGGAGRHPHPMPAAKPATPEPRGIGQAGEADDLRGKFRWMIRQTSRTRWWHEYADALPEWLAFYLYLESTARYVRTYEPGIVPDLLQTAEYARAVAPRRWPGVSAAEIARMAELRARRQQKLARPAPCRVWAVVDESALRHQPALKNVTRAQLRYLIEAAGKQNVGISILPDGIDDNATVSESFTIFRFAERHLGDVVCIERPGGGLFLYEREDTGHYRQLMDILAMRATTDRRQLQRILREILHET